MSFNASARWVVRCATEISNIPKSVTKVTKKKPYMLMTGISSPVIMSVPGGAEMDQNARIPEMPIMPAKILTNKVRTCFVTDDPVIHCQLMNPKIISIMTELNTILIFGGCVAKRIRATTTQATVVICSLCVMGEPVTRRNARKA